MHAGDRGDRLPRRSWRIQAGGRPVEERVVRTLVVEGVELLRIDAADEHRGLVRRRGGHGQNSAVPWVERDDRPAVRRPLVVLVREVDAVAQSLLRCSLQAYVQREPKRVARPRLAPGHVRAHLPTHRVDAELVETAFATQVRVERSLDPRLADAVAGAVALPTKLLELLGRDLPGVPEQLRGERPVRISAEVDLDDLDSGELGLVLVQVVDLLLSDRGLHRDRRDGIEASLRHLAREGPRRDVQDAREPLDEVVPPLLRHVADPELHGRACDVRHDHAPVAVEDRPAGCLDADQPELVVLRGVQVRVAREDLERPEPEEEDREREERDPAEDRDAQSELRCEPVWLLHAWVGRQEALGRRAPLLVGA